MRNRHRLICAAVSTCLMLIGLSARAYIPDYHMIISKTADHHGRGIYLIEQDVVFRGDPDPLVVRETWYVSGENLMRVNIEGRGGLKGLIQGSIIFETNQKVWRDETGSLRSLRLNEDWAEPFFHFRYSKNMKPKLVALKIAPQDSLRDRNPIVSGPERLDYSYPSQDFLRLSRTGGTINYAIGTPTPPDSSSALPGLWIEQDQFVVRKIRLPTQSLIEAADYSRHPEGLWLPRARTYSFGANSVQIFVSSVKWLGRNLKGDQLKTSSLDAQKSAEVVLKIPEQPIIREFYQRFR